MAAGCKKAPSAPTPPGAPPAAKTHVADPDSDPSVLQDLPAFCVDGPARNGASRSIKIEEFHDMEKWSGQTAAGPHARLAGSPGNVQRGPRWDRPQGRGSRAARKASWTNGSRRPHSRKRRGLFAGFSRRTGRGSPGAEAGPRMFQRMPDNYSRQREGFSAGRPEKAAALNPKNPNPPALLIIVGRDRGVPVKRSRLISRRRLPWTPAATWRTAIN